MGRVVDVGKYGQWAVVTGASAGMGACFARHLARDGFDVVLVARRAAKLEEVSSTILAEHPGQRTLVVPADLATTEGIRAVQEATRDLEVGLLVNNAGLPQVGSLWRTLPDKHEQVLNVNCRAPLMLLLHFGNEMMLRGRGGIVNVSSRHAVGPSAVLPLYCASKAFLSCLSVGAAEQLKKHGVDVLVCQPGKTMTPLIVSAGVFNKGKSGASDAMPVDVCVSSTLRELGRRQVTTVGWRAKLYVFIRSYLPPFVSRCLLDKAVLDNSPAVMNVAPYEHAS